MLDDGNDLEEATPIRIGSQAISNGLRGIDREGVLPSMQLLWYIYKYLYKWVCSTRTRHPNGLNVNIYKWVLLDWNRGIQMKL